MVLLSPSWASGHWQNRTHAKGRDLGRRCNMFLEIQNRFVHQSREIPACPLIWIRNVRSCRINTIIVSNDLAAWIIISQFNQQQRCQLLNNSNRRTSARTKKVLSGANIESSHSKMAIYLVWRGFCKGNSANNVNKGSSLEKAGISTSDVIAVVTTACCWMHRLPLPPTCWPSDARHQCRSWSDSVMEKRNQPAVSCTWFWLITKLLSSNGDSPLLDFRFRSSESGVL